MGQDKKFKKSSLNTQYTGYSYMWCYFMSPSFKHILNKMVALLHFNTMKKAFLMHSDSIS